ncbi:hypothetical protein NADFUDRAFT_49667 [Nadsonia fulvescens var. elongata DSM 6958]|uniref:Uncharacterized protein n=1 Tax=Nadsonia fulvescens var. elongata DSM 6958 TaxID=857566 RepID=A0A1E3PPJ7_9ASCO|nr:hypothetical protein NADFUDRAFT_49667 [Nadsonia fulvescens var. elongata DSM 6958]
MVLISYCLVMLLLASPSLSVWWRRDDRACDPSNHAWIPYTGFRIQREYGFDLFSWHPLQRSHYVLLSHCVRGHVDHEVWLPTDSNTDIEWGRDYCPDGLDICYRIVRRKQFVLRQMSIYLPFTFIGGIFACPGRASGNKCTNENARPILPLYADNISHQWFELQVPKSLEHSQIIQRVPYLYTPTWTHPLGLWQYPQPENLAWSLHLDIDEDYDLTVDERSISNKALTQMTNLLRNQLTDLRYDVITALNSSTESLSLALQEHISRLNTDDAKSFLQEIQAPFDQLQLSEKVFRQFNSTV